MIGVPVNSQVFNAPSKFPNGLSENTIQAKHILMMLSFFNPINRDKQRKQK